MRTIFFIYTILAMMILSHSSVASTSSKKSGVEFSYNAIDMNLKTTGKTIHQAREFASEQCFDKRINEYKRRRGAEPSEDQALLIIDSCVNI